MLNRVTLVFHMAVLQAFCEVIMKQFIPINKKSKKAKREYYSQQRLDWNGINPATRVFLDGKTFDRKKIKEEIRHIQVTLTD